MKNKLTAAERAVWWESEAKTATRAATRAAKAARAAWAESKAETEAERLATARAMDAARRRETWKTK